MDVASFYDQLFFTTTRLECFGAGRTWVGTGFIYAVETNEGTAHFLVTNKHVLDGAEVLTARMVQGDGSKPLLGRASQTTIHPFGPHVWKGHPDAAVDVAVMPSWAVLQAMEAQGAPPFFRSIPTELALTRETADDLDSVVDVAFVGYPSGIFDTVNFLPIVRRGTTATPVSVNYRGSPAFLVDASVFPGSSGSPVFLVEQGVSYRRGQGMILGGARQLFLGVMAAVHARKVEGEIVDVATAQRVTLDEPIDLGIVYKAEAIEPVVDALLVERNLTRVQEKVSEPATPTQADEQLGDPEG